MIEGTKGCGFDFLDSINSVYEVHFLIVNDCVSCINLRVCKSHLLSREQGALLATMNFYNPVLEVPVVNFIRGGTYVQMSRHHVNKSHLITTKIRNAVIREDPFDDFVSASVEHRATALKYIHVCTVNN